MIRVLGKLVVAVCLLGVMSCTSAPSSGEPKKLEGNRIPKGKGPQPGANPPKETSN